MSVVARGWHMGAGRVECGISWIYIGEELVGGAWDLLCRRPARCYGAVVSQRGREEVCTVPSAGSGDWGSVLIDTVRVRAKPSARIAATRQRRQNRDREGWRAMGGWRPGSKISSSWEPETDLGHGLKPTRPRRERGARPAPLPAREKRAKYRMYSSVQTARCSRP